MDLLNYICILVLIFSYVSGYSAPYWNSNNPPRDNDQDYYLYDKNNNGEIDVIEDLEESDGKDFHGKSRENALQQLNLPINHVRSRKKRSVMQMDDNASHGVQNRRLPSHMEQEIVSSPVFQKSLDDLMDALGLDKYDPYAADNPHSSQYPNAIPPSYPDSYHSENSIDYKNPDEAYQKSFDNPNDRKKLITNLWPEAEEDFKYMGDAAKEGRVSSANQYTYNKPQATSQNAYEKHARNAYAELINGGYGFNTHRQNKVQNAIPSYNNFGNQPSAEAPRGQVVPNQSKIQELWPSSVGTSYTPNDNEPYPYVPVKSYADTLIPGLTDAGVAIATHVMSEPYGGNDVYQPSNDPHGIVDHVTQGSRQYNKPTRNHGQLNPHKVTNRRRPSDSAVAKEGYGHSHDKGYGSHSMGYGQSHSGGYGHGSGHSSAHSSGGGYGHNSGGYGDHSSGYGTHSSGYGGHDSGYGASSGYGSHGGGYGKTKKWEGGEKSYGSGKKGTKGTSGRESHQYKQGKWHEKHKDNRKTKGNKVKTYSYGGHGWYKEESHGEEKGFGDKDAYSNHEDWAQKKGKHNSQETPHHEYNTKTHGYHKDLGYHRK